MKKSWLHIVVFLLFVCSTEAQTIILPKSLRQATVSLVITDLATKQPILQYDAHKSATPASITKLITTATALEILGADFKFATTIAYDGVIEDGVLVGNLYVIGSGDPSLGSKFFPDRVNFLSDWVSQLKSFGIKRITGNIIADASCYDQEPIPVRWTWEDIGNYYAAGVFGLSCFDNTTYITLRSGAVGSTPEILGVTPSVANLKLYNQLVASSIDFDSAYVYGMPYDNQRWLRGAIPANRPSFVLKGDIPNPPKTLVEFFTRTLIENGIAVMGVPTDEWDKKQEKVRKNLFVYESPSLSELCRVTNVYSHNNFAEHIFKRLALQNVSVATNGEAIQVIKSFWKTQGVDATTYSLNDGSGLSRMNAFSANFLDDILGVMFNSSQFPAYLNSLPIAGEEGTVKSFLRDVPSQVKVYAKSGSMAGVQTYAGYILKGNKNYSFCVMVNNYSGSRAALRKEIEKWLQKAVN